MPIVNDDLFRRVGLAANWPWRRWAVPLLIGATCLALGLGGETVRDWGSYDRAAVENGEAWRLITAHLVHLGWGHLWPNLLALLLICGLLEEFLKPLEWLVASVVTAVAISVGLASSILPWMFTAAWLKRVIFMTSDGSAPAATDTRGRWGRSR